MASPRSGITPSVRWKVFARDGFRCRYCGAAGGEAVLVVDHVFPVARGGRDSLDNLVTACETCNQGKSDSTGPTLPEISLYRDTAGIAASWLYYEWIKLVQTDHPAKVPSEETFARVIVCSVDYAEAMEVLRTVARHYNEGYFGAEDWPGMDNQMRTVEDALVGYADWLASRYQWRIEEGEARYKARYWEETPY